jgi:hypothetical protein
MATTVDILIADDGSNIRLELRSSDGTGKQLTVAPEEAKGLALGILGAVEKAGQRRGRPVEAADPLWKSESGKPRPVIDVLGACPCPECVAARGNLRPEDLS